jgi:hypothetical protein
LPARDIVEAVVRNMRENLEELPYSTLAPSRYVVYLHPTEFARLEGIVRVLEEQTCRALTDELERLGRRPLWRRSADRIVATFPPSRLWRFGEPRRSSPLDATSVGGKGSRYSGGEIEKAGEDWQVTFLPDPDEELEEGGVLVHSELTLPARPELGAGERTRRITTIQTGQHTTVRERNLNVPAQASGERTLARIEFTDDSGPHAHDVVTDSLTIGRGGVAYPVDIRIASSPDVSREHARIRRDPATGVFYLIDLSAFGTTVNGRHVPKGYEKIDGTKRENGLETALPDVARIGLADLVFLGFRKSV